MQLPSRLRSGSWASQGYSSCPVSLESATSGEGRLHWPTKKSLNSSAQKAAGSSNPKLRHPSLAAVGTKSWLLKLALHTFLCGCLDLSEPVFPLVCNINISTCTGLFSRWKNLHIPPPYCVLGLQCWLKKPFRNVYIPTLMGKLARP